VASRLSSSVQVQTLARDLGLKPDTDPVREVLRFCKKRIASFLKEFPGTTTLSELLDLVAASVSTTFEVVRSQDDLDGVKQKYLERGELIFANLDHELADEVFGLTFRRTRREPWERNFVSVIDGRGEKTAREFFTKWHEVGHLLVLTDQLRLSFRRTHAAEHRKDAEESLIDVIAGHVGFYPPFVRPLASGWISFRKVEDLRQQLCPEASWEASVNGFSAAWPSPCILLRAELALRRSEEQTKGQGAFSFGSVPTPALRAIRITPNDVARREGFSIHPRMRVPTASIISHVFAGTAAPGVAEEDLSWWQSSDGTILPARRIRVEARVAWNGVEALVQPV